MATPPPLPPPLPPTTRSRVAPGTPPPALEPLPYARAVPPVEKPRAFPFAWGIFLWSMGVALAWLAFMLLVFPRFEQMFADFKLEVSGTARALFAVRQILQYGGALVVLAIPIALGFFAGPFSPGGRRAVRMVATLVVGLVIIFTVLGVAEPMTQLMQSIGTAGGARR